MALNFLSHWPLHTNQASESLSPLWTTQIFRSTGSELGDPERISIAINLHKIWKKNGCILWKFSRDTNDVGSHGTACSNSECSADIETNEFLPWTFTQCQTCQRGTILSWIIWNCRGNQILRRRYVIVTCSRFWNVLHLTFMSIYYWAILKSLPKAIASHCWLISFHTGFVPSWYIVCVESICSRNRRKL